MPQRSRLHCTHSGTHVISNCGTLRWHRRSTSAISVCSIHRRANRLLRFGLASGLLGRTTHGLQHLRRPPGTGGETPGRSGPGATAHMATTTTRTNDMTASAPVTTTTATDPTPRLYGIYDAERPPTPSQHCKRRGLPHSSRHWSRTVTPQPEPRL